MQKDNIKNAKNYYAEFLDSSKNIELGLRYLENTDFSKVESGRYEILGNEVFAIVQDYFSKPIGEGKFEAHRKYIDIQYVVDGEEQIGVADVKDDCFCETAPYDEKRDIIFFEDNGTSTHAFVKLKAKEFAVFTPEDAHMPSIALTATSFVKKVVVKALV